MTENCIVVSNEQYIAFLASIQLSLETSINDTHEYEHIGSSFEGLTPRIKVNIRESLISHLRTLFNNAYPRIQSRLANEITQILDSAMRALLIIREKSTFTSAEVLVFLKETIFHLLDVDHYPSFIGDYLVVSSSE